MHMDFNGDQKSIQGAIKKICDHTPVLKSSFIRCSITGRAATQTAIAIQSREKLPGPVRTINLAGAR